jgi:type II secretory pathway predicted ATPase ExeA
MYCQFYGLSALPFSLNPDPGVFFPGARYTVANTILEYAVLRREGVLVITGEVGCGKTILIRHFLDHGGRESCIGVISNPSTLRGAPLTAILLAFNQHVSSGEGALLHASLRAFLDAQHAQGRPTVLIVDEAQNLPLETLEELRMLTNPEVNGNGTLQLVLVGQPELQQLLYRPDFSQLLQRVVAHYHLQPMDQAETAEYVAHRLRLAGRAKALFTPAALARIFQGARGVPRLVNMICDAALLYGYTEEMQQIDADVIAQVVLDRGLAGGEPAPSPFDPAASAPRPSMPPLETLTPDLEMAGQFGGGTKKLR